MGKCFAGTALYRSWMVYHHGHILRNKQHTSKLQVEAPSIFSQRENNCGNKRRKMPCYNLHRRWNLSINVRDRDLLLVSLYLRFQFFSYLHFFTFCYLSWATLCDVASSDYYESILFHFMSVLAHSKFPQNWQSFWHNDVGR